MLLTKFFSSLDKIYPETEWEEESPEAGGVMLSNERYSFQLGYRFDRLNATVKVQVLPENEAISLRRVGLVPAAYVRPVDADDNFEKTMPGMFPDPLFPLKDGKLLLCANGANALWITVDGEKLSGGKERKEEENMDIRIRFLQDGENGEEILAEAVYHLTVLPARLPEQKLLFTQWFHSDCLAHWYRVPVFSQEWWQRVDQYLACAKKNGLNLILTPIFTPPLDTAVGKERLTVQLAAVKKEEAGYTFDFSNLQKWIGICRKNGIRHFEISHLFTQWGAGFAPKIVADVDGKQVRIFGWETKADSPEYTAFLDAFLPELVSFLEKEGILDSCFFHISDEPRTEHLASYTSANEIVRKHIGDSKIMDAISDYDFYENGLIDLPVCSTNHIHPFLEKKTEPLFAYYCCGQTRGTANRLFGMPQVRNRCIGVQMYASGVQGFLHWGYNYWLSPGSQYPIDPYAVTDCERTFPGGDSFSVYPTEEGPVESARQVVFYEALQDVRLLELMEEKLGRQRVETLLADWPYLAFDTSPRSAEEFLKLRGRLIDAVRTLA